MTNLPEYKIELNIPQMFLSLAPQKHIRLEGGRGVGKSFIVSWRIRQIVEEMPRAKCAIVGRTYEQLLTRTLPSTIKGLAQLGFVKDLHFFIGTAPPKKWGWQEAYEPPLAYDYCITFYNGTTFQLVSLDKTESGRGFNFDAVIGDEAALLDYEKLQNNVLLSRRGNLEHFGKCPLHYSTLFVSTTPVTNKGRWFIQGEELARQFPEEYFYMIAPSAYNLKNLGKQYFKDSRRQLLPHIYAAEIDCIRNHTAQTPFYPTFSEDRHTYLSSNDTYLFRIIDDEKKLQEEHCKFDADLITSAPIDIALDYNAAINWITCGQMHGNEYKVMNAFYVKAPQIVQDVVQKFCDYYQYHNKKEVNYYYDHTAIGRDPARTTTFSDEVCKKLIENCWKVNRIYCGQAPRHETKKMFFEKLFREDPHNNLPTCRLNQERCKYLIVSIEKAEAIDGRDGVKKQKDKSSEKSSKIPAEEATHGSDAFDTLVYFRITKGVQRSGYMVSAVA